MTSSRAAGWQREIPQLFLPRRLELTLGVAEFDRMLNVETIDGCETQKKGHTVDVSCEYHQGAIDRRMGAGVAKKKRSSVFLIMSDRSVCSILSEGLTEAGYDVEQYQTAREFLIDKRNRTSGIVLAEYRLYGMLGDELVKELANECEAFPIVLIATSYDGPRAVKAGVDFIAKAPTVEILLEAIRRTETPEIFDEDSLRWGFEKLSQGESKVLDGVLAGKGSREIGLDLGISSKTVEAHRGRINAKTRAQDLGELVRMWKAWRDL